MPQPSACCVVLVMLVASACTMPAGKAVTSPLRLPVQGMQPNGLSLALSNTGLDYARQIAVAMLQQEASKITIPEISGTASTPVGDIGYDVSGLAITSCSFGTNQIASSEYWCCSYAMNHCLLL